MYQKINCLTNINATITQRSHIWGLISRKCQGKITLECNNFVSLRIAKFSLKINISQHKKFIFTFFLKNYSSNHIAVPDFLMPKPK